MFVFAQTVEALWGLASSNGLVHAAAWQWCAPQLCFVVPLLGPLLVPKKRRRKHVAQPCVRPFRSQNLAVDCGPKSGTVCSSNGATVHATLVHCSHAYVQLVQQSFYCVVANTFSVQGSEHSALHEPVPWHVQLGRHHAC